MTKNAAFTKGRSAVRHRRIIKFLTYLFMLFMSAIIIYPVLITASSAFKSGNVQAFTLEFSGKWTLDNFKTLFNDTYYLSWYKNTVIIASWSMVIQVIIITLAGFVYSRYQFVGKKFGLMFFIIVQMVPTMAALTAFYVLGNILGGLDQYWLLIAIHVGGGIPMNTWLMKGYFDSVPYDLDESARLDGAGNFRIFAQIVLPLVKPMIAVQSLWAFMGPLGDYILASYLLRSEQNYTVAVGLQKFILDERNQQVVLFATGAILIAVPICILFFYLQKYFTNGLLSGSTKG